MRTQKIDNEELLDRLKTKFGNDTPIFMSEIQEEWKEYSNRRVFEIISKMVEEKLIYRATKGVYYFPLFSKEWNLSAPLSNRTIAYKKYIGAGKGRYGYYSGLFLENNLGLTTQVPITIEIVSNKETTKKRDIDIEGSKFIVRKAKGEINDNNFKLYQLMEVFNKKEISIDDFQKQRIIEYIGEKFSLEDILKVATLFPKRALVNLENEGVLDDIT